MPRPRTPKEIRAIKAKDGATPKKPKPLPAAGSKPFEHNGYTLHETKGRMGNGREYKTYYFARGRHPKGTPTPLPSGFEPFTNKSGFPMLRKKASL